MISVLRRVGLRRPVVLPSFLRPFTSTTTTLADTPYKHVTLEEARAMPRHVSEYSADLVVKAALHGHASSVRERLIREVMSVKHINYQRANAIVNDMSHANSSGLPKFKVPFHAGATLGFVACWASLPLVFDYSTALWFNTAFVTTEVPPAEDLETWLEVGAWTWNWNEPFMGTLMFQFLALEFMRNQAINVGLKPYTEWVQSRRATRLADLFPCYSRTIVRDFAKSNAQFGEDYTGTSKEEIQ